MLKNKDIKLFFSGQAPYEDTLSWQNQIWQGLVDEKSPQYLWLGQHPSSITCGRRTQPENIYVDEKTLAERSTKLFEVDRGGDVTWHGPGQLVGYPLLNLNNFRPDLKWFLRKIEEVLIQTLNTYSIKAFTIEDKTGVWVEHENEVKKIASVGIHVSRWVSKHGFAMNVDTDLSFFDMINPCGLSCQMTSMQELLPQACPTVQEVSQTLAQHFLNVFEANDISVETKSCH